MTCRQLGGACDEVFRADSFEEIARLSKAHGMAMFQKNDGAHLAAMNEMQKNMQSPDAMKEWMAARRREFESLPESN